MISETDSTLLNVTGLTVQFGGRCVVHDVSFSVAEGSWLMLVGPNGAGKSTIVNAISQTVPHEGSVTWCGQDVRSMKPRERARIMGVLAQGNSVGYSFTVDEVVRLGRYAHRPSLFARTQNSDRSYVDAEEKAIEEAIEQTGLTDLRSKSVLELSGGELQRVFLAQALAQQPSLLLLDEPTNHLDLLYQRQTFELLDHWLKAPGHAIISVVHDLSLAYAFGSGVILLHNGQIMGKGPASEVLTPDLLEQVYGMDVQAWMRSLLQHWC
ncbi:MAG: ABC transporter ATP-binding protein [Coriobacteriales bacterium]|nr:ABC transporter ATP-binding protein [Coriobacteriales bacterium]